MGRWAPQLGLLALVVPAEGSLHAAQTGSRLEKNVGGWGKMEGLPIVCCGKKLLYGGC